jgi:hypothetical protein|tara:strand:+ start:133 stop:465 length:333 start_codon:yes stop_codon:yes gene_type:complete
MKWNVTVIALFVWVANYSQSNIEVIQYSAGFVKDNEISLNSFRGVETKTLYISKNKSLFDKRSIKYLPTVVVYHNGEEVIRIESNISLKLPSNTVDLISLEIEEIIESKF